jgi:hypothetical protein
MSANIMFLDIFHSQVFIKNTVLLIFQNTTFRRLGLGISYIDLSQLSSFYLKAEKNLVCETLSFEI